MVRRKNKWKFGFILYMLLLSVFTKSLPIEKSASSGPLLVTTDTNFGNLVVPEDFIVTTQLSSVADNNVPTIQESNATDEINATAVDSPENSTLYVSRDFDRSLRPEQEAREYVVQITFDGNSFRGRVAINTRVTANLDDPLVFHVEDLNIDSVRVGTITEDNAVDTGFNVDDGILEIFPERESTIYRVIIEYNGQIRNDGIGIFKGDFNDHEYIGMNMYPTNARRVFPCMDDLRDASNVKFTFIDVPFNNIIANSELEESGNNEYVFRALPTPLHLWGMLAHNFNTIVIPTNDVHLVGRSGLGQDAQTSIAMNHFFNALNEWTNKPYFEIMGDQDGRMVVAALTDTSVDWHALSTVCIWEPYVFMETIHSVQQRKIGLVKLAEAMARQWFGYVIHPSNWKHQWIINGLGSHAAYEVVKGFQSGDDNTLLLDMNSIFVADVIQESLFRDGYRVGIPLQLQDDIFDEPEVRDYINGVMKYKAPAIMKMLSLTLGNEEVDYIQMVSQLLLNNLALEPISSSIFVDILNSVPNEGTDVGDINDFLEPWTNSRGYPLILVGLRQSLLVVTQEHFGFTTSTDQVYHIPLTYTSSVDLDFTNIHPSTVLENMMTIPMQLSEDDFPIFNIQGQGYYRVNYEDVLWDRIIEFLQDPDRRDQIHPLNRATFIDDALNLARGGKLSYEKALEVVLTMEHETAYAPWKAFVRNMDFLRKRLNFLLDEDDDDELDPDIYVRMLRRAIVAAENEYGFYPDPNVVEPAMNSLTRGLIMDHACKANYQPCIAAAVDWFYDPNSDVPTVNPNIPKDIRPAVYCTMVRENDEASDALRERLDIELSHYERIVILESLACSQNDDAIQGLLTETIADNSPYGMEERSIIFKAVVESSLEGTRRAFNFIQMHTNLIRSQYGGSRKLEELLYLIAENAVGWLTGDLSAWIDNRNNNLDDSLDAAERAEDHALENLIWEETFLQEVYDWIDENDAPKLVLSLALLSLTFIVTFLSS
ncbi:membrane alanyl aminopeptidase-like [Pectinophora gossypiella]|uniref:membrane alanyl aminopeptidase-like n=1 Tax=Pectinophora gossypiella TaxID=13191 RepID=UPI00214E98DF|nr:membrane alanyl aminopeptidase-like [Pectinophora gossypiella]